LARNHARFGRVYMAITSAGTAEPLAYIRTWSFNAASDKVDVTALLDANKIYVAGLPDASGELTFWFDDATPQTYTAAVDGIARKMYLYPTASNVIYWYGSVLPDFNVSGAVDGAVEGTASWNAATSIGKIG
jgi:hypothetical protein